MANVTEEYTLVLRAKDEAVRIVKSLGSAGIKAAKAAAKGFKATGDMLKRVGVLGKKAFASIVLAAKSAGRAIKSTLGSALLPLLAVFGSLAFAINITKEAAEFSGAMSEVATITELSVGQIRTLREEVVALAQEQGADQTKLAAGLYQAISAGSGNARDALVLLNDANRLATAGLAEVDDSVRLLSSSLNAYREDAAAAADFSDTLFTAVRKGITTIPELGASLSQVTPFAAQLGVSFDELLASVAAITKSGTPTAEAVTQVRAAIVALLKSSKDVNALFAKEFGTSFSLATIKAEGLVPVLADLRRAFKGNEDGLVEFLGRVEGASAILNLTGEKAEAFNEILEAMEAKTGATGRAFDKQMADPAFRVAAAWNAVRIEFVEGAGQAIIETLNEAIDRVGGLEVVLAEAKVAAAAMRGVVKFLTEGFIVAVKAIKDFLDTAGGVEGVSQLIDASFELIIASLSVFSEELRNQTGALIDAVVLIPTAFRSALAEIPGLFGETNAETKQEIFALEKALFDERKALAERKKFHENSLGVHDARFFGLPEPKDSLVEIYSKNIKEMETRLADLQSTLKTLPAPLSEVTERINSLAGADGAVSAEATSRLEKAQEQMGLIMFGLARGTTRPKAKGEPLPPGTPVRSPIEGPTESADPLKEAIDKAKNFAVEQAALMGEVVKTFEEQKAEIDAWAIKERERLDLMREDGRLTEDQTKKLGDLIQRIREERTATAEAAKEKTKFQESAEAAGSIIETQLGGALKSVISGSAGASEAFGDFARNVVVDIAAMIVQASIMAGLKQAFPSIFPAAKGGVFPGGLSFYANGGVISGGLNFPGYANGGIASAPQLAMIGEGRNTEAVIPMPDNRHVPVKIMGDGAGGGGGGGGITVNVNAGSNSGRDFERQIAKAMPQIIKGVERGLLYQRGFQQAVRRVAGKRS